MVVTRIIDLFHFSRQRGRFIDSAFKNSSRLATDPPTPDGLGGISIIETQCACTQGLGNCGDCMCRHIGQHYGELVDDPFMFWTFDSIILDPPTPNPAGIPQPLLVRERSGSQDDCHLNIYHVEPKRADKFRKAIPFADVRLCINGACEPFSMARALELQELREALALDDD